MRSAAVSFLVVCGIGGALQGCSTLNSIIHSGSTRREMAIESNWVRSTTKSEFLGFRRMNRMSPLLYESGPLKLVIQANAIDGMVAYDRATGSERWRLDLKNGVEGGAAISGDRLYFGSSDGSFYCVSIRDGRVLWNAPLRAETLAPPSVEGGVVYVQNGADVVFALDAESGKQLWRYNRQVTGSLSIRATTRPVVARDLVLAGFADGYLVALKKRDGGMIWERKLGESPRFHDVDSTPVVDGANVYVASFDASLYSLKLDSGAVNWTVNEGGYVPVTLGSGPFADRLFYSTANGKILIIDKDSGKLLNEIKVAKGIATQPVLYKGYLIYGESEGAYIIADARSGAVVTRFFPGVGLVSKPTVVDSTGEAFFISSGANLYALRMNYKRTGDTFPWRREL